MKRVVPTSHRLPDWFKREIKHRKRQIGESKERFKMPKMVRMNAPQKRP